MNLEYIVTFLTGVLVTIIVYQFPGFREFMDSPMGEVIVEYEAESHKSTIDTFFRKDGK